MDWRGLQQRIATLWEKVPRPIRWVLSVVIVVWRVLGWIDDHVGRIIVLVVIIGAAIAGGAFVIGYYLSEVDPLWIYVGVLGSVAILIWGVAGVATLVRVSLPAPPVTTSETDPTLAETPDQTKIRLRPILMRNEARLRVENNGPEAHIGFSLERVSDFEDDAIPFRMKWAEPDVDNDFFARTLGKAPVRTQKRLAIGGLESAVVAYAFEGTPKLYIPMPDDLRLEVPRPRSGEIELTVAILSNPPLAEDVAGRTTYVIELSRSGRIKDFRVKRDEAPKS